MSAAETCPTLARLADEGVVLSRFESEDSLYTGTKDLYGFLIVAQGSSSLRHRGRDHRVSPGAIVLAEPGEIYRDQHRDGPATFDIVLIDGARVDAERARTPSAHVVGASPVLSPDDVRARPLLALHQLLTRGVSDFERDVALARASRALLSADTAAASTPSAARGAIVRARAYLRERMLEHVRLDDLADHVRLDKYHLIRAFRAQVGVPPYEYLTQLRMRCARELLRAGMSSAHVAAHLGYCDQSQFHRHFVRLVGTTPGNFVSRAAPRFLAHALEPSASRTFA